MNEAANLNRRRFCLTLASLPVLSGCASSLPSQGVSKLDGQRRVTALLPLSGPRAELGRRMAKAVWLSEDLGVSTARTNILDSGDSAQMASAAASQAVAAGSDVIVGPLFREQTSAVLKTAGDVPVLTLSNDNSLATQGAWVFGVTPEQSAQAVLNYAAGSGAKRIATLEDNGPLGIRSRAALSAGSRATILPVVPANTNPSRMGEALRSAGGGELPDIIYVPGASSAVLEQAVAAVETGVTTIGSVQWSGLSDTQFSRLDKACFTGPDPQKFNQLSTSFRTQLDDELGIIGALAVDAVAYARGAGSGANLTQRKPIDGLLGAARFEPNRVCSRSLAVLRINGDEVVRVA